MARVEQNFHVKENSKISDIYSQLNSVQKKAIVLFDTDRSGTIDAKESKAFNSSVFSEQSNGDLDVYLQLSSGKRQKTTVKQNELDNTLLSLEKVKNEKIELINGKKVRIITTSDTLRKRTSKYSVNEIIKLSLDEYGNNWKKGKTDANGNTKYTASYTAEDGSYNVSDYKIFDISGNVIEEQETLQQAWEDSCWIYGKRVSKNGVESYYDSKGNLAGTVAYDKSSGMTRFSDKYGNCLYYQIGNDYYDKNKELKYKVQPADDPLNYPSKAIMYENGKVLKTKTVYLPLGDTDIYQPFHELSERYIGEFEDQDAEE